MAALLISRTPLKRESSASSGQELRDAYTSVIATREARKSQDATTRIPAPSRPASSSTLTGWLIALPASREPESIDAAAAPLQRVPSTRRLVAFSPSRRASHTASAPRTASAPLHMTRDTTYTYRPYASTSPCMYQMYSPPPLRVKMAGRHCV
mmetsp:Transcript_73346/g.145919  ORF Transcript_73346/g.145919 Transcript_73346/m.145919 type:complete len:153 (-) Transcript_73346:1063-1521(-)